MAGKNESADFILTRVLNAPRELVWKVYTEEKHMVQWWGPKGFEMQIGKLDFRVGGIFHYGMKSPDGTMMWGKLTYTEIVKPEKLSFIVSFSDENAGVTRHPMAPTWPAETLSITTFDDLGDKTRVNLTWRAINASPEECALFDASHANMNMGHEGTFQQLEAYIAELQKK